MDTAILIVILIILVAVFIYAFDKAGADEQGCCVGCLSVVVASFVLWGVYRGIAWLCDFSREKYNAVIAWRDERLAERNRQEALVQWKQQEAQNAEQRRLAEEARLAEEQRRKNEQEEKIRSFALKEASGVWAAYQALQSEIEVQNVKIEELRDTLVKFGKVPDEDADFKRITALRDDMIRSHKGLRKKLEDAYITWRKYEAAPSRKDYQELHRKAIEDGIREADAASEKFKEMRLNK